MSILKILEYPDRRLRKIAKPVSCITKDISRIIEDMFETMYTMNGIGLAATQVNFHKQIFVVDLSEKQNQQMVFINPELIQKSGNFEFNEGCLSIPRYRRVISRAENIWIRAMDCKGNTFELEAKELVAACIQHEMDHLFGKLLIDYAVSSASEDFTWRK